MGTMTAKRERYGLCVERTTLEWSYDSEEAFWATKPSGHTKGFKRTTYWWTGREPGQPNPAEWAAGVINWLNQEGRLDVDVVRTRTTPADNVVLHDLDDALGYDLGDDQVDQPDNDAGGFLDEVREMCRGSRVEAGREVLYEDFGQTAVWLVGGAWTPQDAATTESSVDFGPLIVLGPDVVYE